MLSVKFYQNTNEVFTPTFLNGTDKNLIVVCPGPQEADRFRERWISSDHEKKNIDVLTIYKFVSNQIALAEVDSLKENVKNKSQLKLLLSTVWRESFNNTSYEVFNSTFNIFTELRSFTLEYNLIEEILDEFSDEIKKGIFLFWSIVDQLNIVDEHKTYQILSHLYQDPKSKIFENIDESLIVIWGFKQLSSIQIDLIKSLSHFHDVVVPYSETTYQKTIQSDWIRWFEQEASFENTKNYKTCKIKSFPRNKLADGLNVLKKDFPTNNIDLILTTADIGLNECNEIPYGDVFFKAPIDLFSSSVNLVEKNVLDNFDESVLDFKGTLTQKIKDEIERKNNNFKLIKVFSLYLEIVEEWMSLSENNIKMTLFDFKVVSDSVKLGLPRLYALPLLQESNIEIKDVEAYGFREDRNTIVCATSNYTKLLSNSKSYTEKVLEFLESLGPIMRNELIFLYNKNLISEILENENTYLAIEEDLLDHDPAWSEILSSFEDKLIEKINLTKNKKIKTDYLESYIIKEQSNIGKVSATKLQTYIDCPRKYYFNYVNKINIDVPVTQEMTPLHLGRIQHKVIENFFNTAEFFNKLKHNEKCKEIFEYYITSNGMLLSYAKYQQYFLEVVTYSMNGLNFLYYLKTIYPEFEFHFETDIVGDSKITGSIDCIIKSGKKIILLDFKRSKSSIPSKKDLEEFKKVQLWFYLEHYDLSLEDVVFFGYLNLSEISESLILDNSSLGSFSDEYESTKVASPKWELSEKMEEYAKFEGELILRLENEVNFSAIPLKPDACNYCRVNTICSKGDVLYAKS